MTVEATETRSLPRRRVRLPWWGWLIAGIVVLALVVAAFGGFGVVPVEKARTVELGEPVAGAEVDVQVDRVEVTDRLPGALEAVDGEQVLVVTAVFTNRADVPTVSVQERIRVIAGGVLAIGDAPDRVVDLRNADPVGFLQPALPTAVQFAWPMNAGALDDVDQIFIGILDRIPITDDPIYGDTAYTEPRAIARLVIEQGDGP